MISSIQQTAYQIGCTITAAPSCLVNKISKAYDRVMTSVLRNTIFSGLSRAKPSYRAPACVDLLPFHAYTKGSRLTHLYNIRSPVTQKPIKALYMEAPNHSSKNTIFIQIHPMPYQELHPAHANVFLGRNMDVVLFNPTQADPRAMCDELKTLYQEIHRRYPNKQIGLYGAGFSGHIALKAAEELEQEIPAEAPLRSIPLVVDRAFHDAYAVAKSVSALVRFAQSAFKTHFDLRPNVQELQGPICFIEAAQGQDQILHHRRHNFSEELRAQRGLHPEDVELTLPKPLDHFSLWDKKTRESMRNFFVQNELAAANSPEITEAESPRISKPHFFRRRILPWLTSSLFG